MRGCSRPADRLDAEIAVGSNRRQVLEKYSQGRTVTLDFRNPERGARQIVATARRYPLRAVVPLPEGNRYLGFIFARNVTPKMVEKSLREAHRRLDFDIDD